jgi:hypothetical protein
MPLIQSLHALRRRTAPAKWLLAVPLLLAGCTSYHDGYADYGYYEPYYYSCAYCGPWDGPDWRRHHHRFHDGDDGDHGHAGNHDHDGHGPGPGGHDHPADAGPHAMAPAPHTAGPSGMSSVPPIGGHAGGQSR